MRWTDPANVPRIRMLPVTVRERVAAGEVIDGPAAVVKELIENSLDAGATRVDVEVEGAGAQSVPRLIRVADDGHGIPPEDVELAFQRYATSKIQTADDLGAIQTLGFRGEALPSIAAVSEVTLVTRTRDGSGRVDPGTCVVVSAGELVRRGHEARVHGTTVTVRRLFERLPGRLKFVQSQRLESRRIAVVVRRLALAWPDVRFSLRSEGRLVFQTQGIGPRQVLADVYGPAIADSAAVIGPCEQDSVRVYGFVGGRELTRPTRADLCLYVNGRWVESTELLSAIEAGYRPVFPRGRHPIVVLFLEMPTDEVDVNVHPSKREVRFVRQRATCAILTELVRDSLGGRPATPLPLPLDDGLPSLLPSMPARRARGQGSTARRIAEHGWQQPRYVTKEPRSHLRAIAQIGDALLVCEADDGLYLVDQHRAHERVLYERFRRQFADSDAGRLAQGLVEPIVLELKPHEAKRLASRLDDLAALGLRCEWFGARGFVVHTLPALGDGSAIANGLSDVLAAASSEGDWRDQLIVTLACRSALRKGRGVALAEANALLDELARTEAPAVCPHGAPIVVHLNDAFLAKQFDWR